jgi:hypothetical protein
LTPAIGIDITSQIDFPIDVYLFLKNAYIGPLIKQATKDQLIVETENRGN